MKKRTNGMKQSRTLSARRGAFMAALLACGMLALAGCGDSGEPQHIGQAGGQSAAESQTDAEAAAGAGNVTELSESTPAEEPTDAAGYVFVLDGTVIAIDAPMAPVLAALGEPDSYFEAASCAFEGVDKTYTYPLIEIQTYPEEDGSDVDLIFNIYLRSEEVSTPEGLHIGSPAEDIAALYGNDFRELGSEVIYEKDEMELHIMTKDDVVTSITYATTILNRI